MPAWFNLTNCLLMLIAFLLLILVGPSLIALGLVGILNIFETLRDKFSSLTEFIKKNWMAILIVAMFISLIILIIKPK